MAWIYSGPGPRGSVMSSGSALWLSSETAGAGVATLRDREGWVSLIITGFEEEALCSQRVEFRGRAQRVRAVMLRWCLGRTLPPVTNLVLHRPSLSADLELGPLEPST